MNRYLCIHGHFYQPPRENAWLEAIETQDSAYPYHDWNERINAESYSPNSAARILSGDNRIIDIINNYSKMSFNFGPTLLSWMEQKTPETYEAILEADRISQEQFSGHGSALAQVYNHMIMPLASARDKRTQVYWGIRDFQHRFGRDPEGMWLPETAVDLETLEVLADYGIQFTILSPYQAARIRELDPADPPEDEAAEEDTAEEPENNWIDVSGGKIDPKRPYLCRLPSGKSIALFFYDGPISQEVG
ncbi:MAG TPA: glycoside hydrolase, partial [Gammaproteobacteria bacterium]|nr:glycoside hydrolase [Gammaproteobacteria bacterium]